MIRTMEAWCAYARTCFTIGRSAVEPIINRGLGALKGERIGVAVAVGSAIWMREMTSCASMFSSELRVFYEHPISVKERNLYFPLLALLAAVVVVILWLGYGARIERLFSKLLLYVRIAELYVERPDAEFLMPIKDVKKSKSQTPGTLRDLAIVCMRGKISLHQKTRRYTPRRPDMSYTLERMSWEARPSLS
jgi:hypothetical protein